MQNLVLEMPHLWGAEYRGKNRRKKWASVYRLSEICNFFSTIIFNPRHTL